jgi:hypothetical protein
VIVSGGSVVLGTSVAMTIARRIFEQRVPLILNRRRGLIAPALFDASTSRSTAQ